MDYELRTTFLKEFVWKAMNNTLTPEEKKEIEKRRVENIIQAIKERNMRREEPKMMPEAPEPAELRKIIVKPESSEGEIIHANRPIIVKEMTGEQPVQTYGARALPGHPESQDPMEKINLILNDPRIQSIECQGPDKNIFVKRDGKIMRAKVVLTKNDIDAVLNSYSRTTRVPLVGGTFKAAIGNIIITAVISDFVGSRFIIQKRNPFAPLIY